MGVELGDTTVRLDNMTGGNYVAAAGPTLGSVIYERKKSRGVSW
jgi:hypothetical protein